ncbi:thiamine phosphate synthase [Adhaeribacter aquaticus]|uniref:thiamine phosphate synthase n=1 Tax=Adhaeribacter aquaticus TaxID=299567 RepID=UPI00040E95A5|nr:thiamine phosphate synthase [Adhaeribacter aquaticus]
MYDNSKFVIAAIKDINSINEFDGAVINNLFLKGLDLFYVRGILFTEVSAEEILKKVQPIFHSRVILPFSVTSFKVEGDFVRHLKEAERKANMLTPNLSGRKYSTSIHSLPDIDNLPDYFNYVYYSPLFESISKPGYLPKQRLDEVKEELKKIRQRQKNLPLVIGLGGVKVENINEVKKSGFDGAALMGALWQSEDPVKAFLAIKNKLQ